MWYFSNDNSPPVIQPGPCIQSKYSSTEIPALPSKAVVFCLGKGLPVLEERFSTCLLMEELPGFITHSKVLRVSEHPDVCFLHGGYGSPQIACTMETLHALGVKEAFLIGLCGGFGEDTQVGAILLPEKIWSEEGCSRHYYEAPRFAQVNSPQPLAKLAEFLEKRGFCVRLKNTVTTDAVYRQTYYKEALWRKMGCEAVDMEASAFVSLCNYYGMKSTVALMVSDRHPLHEGDPAWVWGSDSFRETRDNFIAACVSFSLKNKEEENHG